MTELTKEYIKESYLGLNMVDNASDSAIDGFIDRAVCIIGLFEDSFWKNSNCQYLEVSSNLTLHFMMMHSMMIARMNGAGNTTNLDAVSLGTQRVKSYSAEGFSKTFEQSAEAARWNGAEYSETPFGIAYLNAWEKAAKLSVSTYWVV